MDEGFYAYTVIGKVLLSEVEELIMHFVVMCNDKASNDTAKSAAYGEGLIVSVQFLKV